MSEISNRFPDRSPRSDSELLHDTARIERRHDGPLDGDLGGRDGDEIAARRRWERDDPQGLLRADLRRFQCVRAEHLRWLRISVRQFRAVLRQPESADRTRQIAFARDAVQHNKESVRIWTAKVADAQEKLDRLRPWAAAAE